ncbi:MAG: hypothetical protein LAO05_18285 [Acidobacteriia bacterium]|nr:hypothetical protein [Terriglobia bacterium]
MASNQRATSSRGRKFASQRFCAMALVASWLAAGAAAGGEANVPRPASELPAAAASNKSSKVGSTDPALATLHSSFRPKVSGPLPASLWSKLGFALGVAREKIRTIPSCSGLFTSRGADGLELLARASFAGAALEKDHTACAGSAVATTEVGGRQIRLCPRFEALSVPAAALILIHETLHTAGMREKPPDPSALTSAQINQLVEARCGR